MTIATPERLCDCTAPPEARRAFVQHYYNAERRGIAFLMCLPAWWDFWSVDDRWQRRGRGGDRL